MISISCRDGNKKSHIFGYVGPDESEKSKIMMIEVQGLLKCSTIFGTANLYIS